MSQLATWLEIEPSAGGPRIYFDDAALSDAIIAIKSQINRPPRDAAYAPDGGVFRVTAPSQVGLWVDGPAAFYAALAALTEGGERTIELAVTEIAPRVTEANVAAMEGERWIRVDLGAQRMYAMVGDQAIYTAVISSGKGAGRRRPAPSASIPSCRCRT